MATAQPLPQVGRAFSARMRDKDRPIASALGLPQAHVSLIEDSHERCAALGLSRIERPDFAPLGRSDLSIARERNLRLHSHAAPVMEMLFEQIINTGNMVVLCDASGTLIHSVGDDEFLQRAAKVALAPGVNWSESSKGTNGIGTALISEQATLVHADEHYLHANHFLTCSAAPITDPRGNVLGVLDVSGDQRSYHQHTMALVKMSARMIENQWLLDNHRQAMRLHFHSRLGYIGSLLEGIVAVSPEGRVLGANRSALELLQLSSSALRQRTLMSLFGVRVGTLADHFRSPLAVPLQLHTDDGREFLLHARFDWPMWSQVAEAAARSVVTEPATAGATATAPSDGKPASQATAGMGAAALQCLQSGDTQIAGLVARLQRVVDLKLPIMLCGESGSGKKRWARALHAASARASQPLWAINCGALHQSCLDAELERQRQSSACAMPGTLLLCNVGDLPLPAQAQLLRLLQSADDETNSHAKPKSLTPAIICTTPHDLREMIEAKRFRQDLYYRLNGLSARLPALRERTDLAQLARTMLDEDLHAPALKISPDALALLHNHAWPGNVRQLFNVLRAAAALAGDVGVVRPDHLPEDFLDDLRQARQRSRALAAAPATIQVPAERQATGNASDSVRTSGAPGALSPLSALSALSALGAGTLGSAALQTTYAAAPSPEAQHTAVSHKPSAEPRPLHEVERQAIEQAVEAAGGNLSLAAKRLGVSRNTIYRRLRWNESSSS